MARRFTAASSERVTLSLGALGIVAGPVTIAAVARINASSGSSQYVCSVGTGAAGVRLGLGYDNTSGRLAFMCGSTIVVMTTVTWTLGEYVCAAVTKATGTVAPRGHTYRYSTGVWSHVNHAATVADSSTLTTNAFLGQNVAGAQFLQGDVAIAAVWDVVLTDSQVESLQSDLTATNWSGYAEPRALWIPDRSPSVTVIDQTGNGANETTHSGTSAPPDDNALLLAGSRLHLQYVA